jgi:hypothetical protein
MFRYTDDVLLLNNSRFGDFVVSIYIVQLVIKDTADTAIAMWQKYFTFTTSLYVMQLKFIDVGQVQLDNK